jgi:hypothetical protein
MMALAALHDGRPYKAILAKINPEPREPLPPLKGPKPVNGGCRRVSLLAVRRCEGRLAEPTATVRLLHPS